jgi:hypothetical protein
VYYFRSSTDSGSPITFNGDVVRELATQFLALAQKHGATVPLMIAHRLMGQSLLYTGDVATGRTQYDQAITLYDPAEHRPLATRFGQDVGVAILCYRSFALWVLGYPEAARTDIDRAIKDAREIGHAATLTYTIAHALLPYIFSGDHATEKTPPAPAGNRSLNLHFKLKSPDQDPKCSDVIHPPAFAAIL